MLSIEDRSLFRQFATGTVSLGVLNAKSESMRELLAVFSNKSWTNRHGRAALNHAIERVVVVLMLPFLRIRNVRRLDPESFPIGAIKSPDWGSLLVHSGYAALGAQKFDVLNEISNAIIAGIDPNTMGAGSDVQDFTSLLKSVAADVLENIFKGA